MGVFDSGIDPSLLGGSNTKRASSPSRGVFDSGIDEELMWQAPEEPATGHELTRTEVPITFENKIPSSPSPKVWKPTDSSSSDVSQFSSALGAGDFSVSGTPTPEPKKNVIDRVTRGYDAAPDKWRYKQTLSNTELDRLDQTRPDNSQFSSPVIHDASVKASDFPSIQKAKTSIEQDDTANTIWQLAGQNFDELNPAKALGNTAEYTSQKFRGIRKEVLEPTVGKSLYEAVHGVSMDENFIEKRKLGKGQQALRGARAIVDTVFAPLNVVAYETSNQEDQSIYGGIGNVANRFAALPFEASYSTASAIAQTIGMDKETADDLGIVLAAFAPVIMGMKKSGATTKEISEYVNRSSDTFNRVKDFTPEEKKLFREGARELHPDVSGLPHTYMARFNDAAYRGDITAMRAIVEEGKAAKASDAPKAYATTTEMREAAKKGDENAVIRDSQFKESVKETAIEVKDPEGRDVATVETVKYDDGTVAARVTVAIDPQNEVVTPFTEHKDEATAVKSSLEDAAVLAESAGSENAAIIRSEAKATSKSVPDNTQSASIKDGVVTVTNKHGRSALGKYSFTLEEYEKAKRTSANQEWGISEFIKAKNREAFPDNYRDMENFSLINRIEDSQIYAIKDAIKKLGSESSVKAPEQVRQTAPESGNAITEATQQVPAASSVKAETQVGDKPSPTSAKDERALAIYEDAGIPRVIAESNLGRIKDIANNRYILHPDNKYSRKVFEFLTGMKLPNGVAATNEFLSANSKAIKSALQESDKEVKSSEPNQTTNADRQESVPDAGKQAETASGGRGESVGAGLTRGEWKPSASELGAGSNDGGNGSAGKELAVPKVRFGKTARAKLNADVKSMLEKKGYSTKFSDYTAEEIRMMKEYSGAGGKIDKGAEGRGVLDEFYTPREIVESMWKLVDAYLPWSIKDAKILEPSAGVGRFIESAPVEKNVTAYELDKVSGTVLQVLHPLAKSEIRDFQTLFVENSGKPQKSYDKFDVVIGNPPYGDRAGLFKGLGEESNIGRWEDYFIKRGLDMTNDNGVLVYIVPSSFLDGSKETRAKTAIGKQAYLLDAFRMPEGVFEDTQVATDILVFKKSTEFPNSEALYDGGFFKENPNRVLWKEIERKNRFGREETAITGSKEEAIAKLSELVSGIEYGPKKAVESLGRDMDVAKAESIAKAAPIAPGETTVTKTEFDGESRYVLTKGNVKAEVIYNGESISDAIDVPEAYIDYIQRGKDESSYKTTSEWKGLWKVLIEEIKDTFKEKGAKVLTLKVDNWLGFAGESGNKLMDYYKSLGFRHIGDGAMEYDLTKHVSKKSVAKSETKPRSIERAPKKAEKIVDVSGIPTVESQTLNVGTATVQELEIFAAQEADGSVPASALEAHPDWAPYLNYEGGRYYHDVNYFSGDIRQRLDALDRDKKKMGTEQHERQKAGLLSVLPEDKRIDEITFDPTDRFVTKIETGKKKRIYNRFSAEEVPMNVEDAFVDWVHSIDRKLIGYGVMKGDIENFVRGNRQRQNTKLITVHIKSESRRLFNQFMRDGLDVETQKKIVSEFNRTKNSYVRPEYDKIPVVVKGMATEYHGKPFELSTTQRNGVGFLVNKGSGLVAYGVGVGKTHSLLIATKANMDKGWTKRPVFIVPASTLSGWIDTTKRMFPGTKVNNLAGLQAPVVAKLRKAGAPSEWVKDGDITFLTHEGILRLGFDESEILDLTKDLNDALWTFDYKLTTREIEKSKEKAQEVLGQSLRGSTDILMRELGIDHISVDEVHNFRKVFQGAKIEEDAEGKTVERKRFSNVTGGTPSARARKLFLVSQYVQKKNGGRNVFLASATPFENHATEVYNILSFMARERMRAMGIYNINDFYSTFANFQTETVQKGDGTWQEKEVMKSFSNLKQLQSLLQEFIDKKEEKTLVRPEKVVIAPQLKMSPLQSEVKQKIREMIASDDDGVLLKATTYMKANSFSPYFVSEFGGVPKDMYEFVKNSPKVEYAMEMLRALKNDPATASRSNLVYIGSEGISFTPMYVEYLVKEVGFKRDEIGVITGEVTDDQREDIKQKFNTGEIKVLIGGTPTKEGINLQMNGYATFNLSLGWNPTEMAQVEGRIWRQGNNLNKALIVYPIVENSGDIGIYQKFEEKASRINDLFSYEGDVFDVGEIDPKEKKLLLLTDPTEKANLAIKLEEASLQSRKLYLDSELSELEKSVSELKLAKSSAGSYPETIAQLKKNLEALPEGSYRIDSTKRDIETYEKELKSAKDKVKRIEEKFAQRELSDPQSEIESLKTQIESVQKSITDSKLAFERLLEKYQNEYDQGILNTKSMEDHRAQILAVNSNLVERTPTELAAEKVRLSNEVVKEQDAKIEAAAKKSVSEWKDPGEDGGVRVPSSVPRRSPSGSLSSKSDGGISSFEKSQAREWTESFKLSQRVEKIIDGLGTQYTRYVAPGSVGTFYTWSKNVALRSINDIQTAHHELSHLVDDRIGITEKYLAVTGRTKNGSPIYDPRYAKVRERLTEIYMKRYPGARKTDKLRIRVKEGYAALQEHALAFPTATKRDFPDLWKEFVENGHDLQKWLNSEMRMVVDDYQGLSANDRIGAVTTDVTKNKEAESFLTFWERMKETWADSNIRFEKADKIAGKYGTAEGVADFMRASPWVNRRVAKNLQRWMGFWQFKNRELVEMPGENWGDLVHALGQKGTIDTFWNYLVARNQHFEWERLDALEEKVKELELEAGPFATRDDMAALDAAIAARDELKSVLSENSKILPRDLVDEMHAEFKEEFSHESAVFDRLSRADLDFQRETGRLSSESYADLTERKGYAPMKRSLPDQIVGDGAHGISVAGYKVGKSSFLKKRTGATHDIVNPLLGGILNHTEGMRKGYAQEVQNRLVGTLRSDAFRKMAQEVPIETVKVGESIEYRVNGKSVSEDPNVIVQYQDGKPKVALVIGKEISEPLKMATEPFRRSLLEVALNTPARVFTTGTTGLFPAFSVGNASSDQFTAFINSKTGYVPFLSMSPVQASKALYYESSLRKWMEKLGAEIADYDTPDAKFIKEFITLGGDVMSLSDIHRMTGDEIIAHMSDDVSAIGRIQNGLVAGLDLADAVLGTPGRVSELATRITEYVSARKAGKDMWTALAQAEQVSLPFGYRGTIEKEAAGRVLIGWVPYFRASIHALSQLLSSIKNNPGAAWRASAVVAITAAVFAYLAQAYDEMEEEDKIALQNMDVSTFAQYVVVPKGGWEFWKFKMDRQLSWIPASIFMLFMEARHGFKYSASEYGTIMTAWMPEQMQIWKGTGWVMSVLPQWMKPSVELATGKRTFPDVRDIESAYDKLFSSEDRYDKSSSKAAIALWQTEFAKDADISPKEIDTFIRETFGRSIDAITMGPKFWDVSNPLVAKEYFTSGRVVRQFFSMAEKSEQEKNSAKKNGVLTPYESARVKKVAEVKELFKELRGFEPGTPEYSKQKAKIWEAMAEAVSFSEKDVTESDVASFGKAKESEEWGKRKAFLASQYADLFRASKEFGKATKLENALKKEIIGNAKKSDPNYSSLQSRANATIEEFRMQRSGDDFIKWVQSLQTNAEKVVKFKTLESTMTKDEYSAKIRDYHKRKLISDDLKKLLLKNR